jgi:hypothetical protein
MTAERESVSEDKDIASKPTWRERIGQALRPGKMDPARRRLLIRVLVVVALLALIIGVPAYIALQPQFVQRYPNLAPKYKSWSTSVHAEVACRSCHVAPGPLAQTAFAARMVGEFYLSLVLPGRQPNLFGPPLNSACQSCHIDLRTVSPSGDLNIPHQAHVVVLKLPCVRCHTYLVHDKNPEGTHTPRMVNCLKCHDGKTAKNGCSTCHTNKAIPESHRAANWTVIHPTMVDKINCKQCHGWTTNWCSACHQQRPASHGPDWRKVHGTVVAKHRNCEACHTADWCIRCHGMVPQLNFNPALKLVQ